MERTQSINDAFISGNIEPYLHFALFHNFEMIQGVKILPNGLQGLVYPAYLIPWLLMAWWCKDPGPQQAFQQTFQHQKNSSLAPRSFKWNFRQVIFKLISVTDGWGISCEIAHRWMLRDLTDDKLILVQVMAWCRQATCHYLSQCWPRSLSPYGVTRLEWVNI